jgi:hypothetical protein
MPSSLVPIILILIPILYWALKPRPLPGIPNVLHVSPLWGLGHIPTLIWGPKRSGLGQLEWFEMCSEKMEGPMLQVGVTQSN